MKNRIIIISLLVCLFIDTPFVMAGGGLDLSEQEIYFYDNNSCLVTGTGSGTLVGNDNAEKIMRFLVGKKLTTEQAAGIMGNIRKESTYRSNVEEGNKTVDDNYTLKDGTGFGIVQWTSGGRQQGLVSLSKSSNRGITDLSLQLDYLWQELTTGYKDALDELKKTNNPVDAAISFENTYERSADSDEVVRNVRGAYAQEAYDQFNGIVPDVNNNEISGNIVCTSSGDVSMFAGNFAIYNQNDPQWNNTTYGTSTIGIAGCGPSAMAMIITNLTGSKVTPVETAKYAEEHGMWVENHGSSHAIASVLSSHWGLNSSGLSDKSDANLKRILLDTENPSLILAVADGNAPYTSYGHFIVIRGISGDKYLVGDSNGAGGGMANSQKEWDYSQVAVSGVNMWVISK